MCRQPSCTLLVGRWGRIPARIREGSVGHLVFDSWLNMSQQCAQVGKKANSILTCTSNSRASRTRAVAVPLCPARHLKSCVQFWPLMTREVLECERGATELGKGLEHKSDEELLKELGLLNQNIQRVTRHEQPWSLGSAFA
ncbi:hypothetical protein BTVI_33728 [Pitangus sulphuratus]|nr:hypothetical protein BTVI_33728 [Pitangus sulphuratus]